MKRYVTLELRTHGVSFDGEKATTRELIDWESDSIDDLLCAEVGDHAKDLMERAKTYWEHDAIDPIVQTIR